MSCKRTVIAQMTSEREDLIGFTASELAEKNKPRAAADTVERRYKTGVNRQQAQLVGYELEDFLDNDNPVRAINAFVDSLNLKQLGFTNTLAHSGSGQPAYSPNTMLKLFLYGYRNGICSTRKLARECKRNVEVMWLLDKLSPEYRTIGAFRACNAKAIREVHKQFIGLCNYMGLLSEDRVSVDGSHFKGNVSSKSFRTTKGLNKRNAKIEQEIDEWNKQIEQTDAREDKEETAAEVEAAMSEVVRQIQKLETEKEQNDFLLKLLEETGLTHISRTDTEAQRLSKRGNSCQGYNVQIVTESQNRLIVSDDVTNRSNDREELFNMASLAKEALGADKLDVLGDQGYSSARQFKQCYDNDITPYVPIMTPRSLVQAEHRYKVSQFTYDKELNAYICPMGEQLRASGKPKEDGTQRYRSRKASCEKCCKRQVCLTEKGTCRDIHRSGHEELMTAHRKHMEKHPEVMRERASMVEHPFGTIKVRAGWPHFLVRGLEKVTGEWSLMALSYNLTRVLNILGMDKFMECCRESQAQGC